MTPPGSSALPLIAEGVRAFRRGDWIPARDAAVRAIQQDPDLEDAWLLLAALSMPDRRATYLQRVLTINPTSKPARAALAELENGKPSFSPELANVSLPSVDELISRKKPSLSGTELAEGLAPAAEILEEDAKREASSAFKTVKSKNGMPLRFRWSIALISISCLLALIAAVFGRGVSSAQELPVMARMEKAQDTLPATLTPSFTPSVTPSFTPTFTPTNTPTPTYTPSPTRIPTNTKVPTVYVPPPPAGVGGGEHWVDVDISSQTLTAYAGDTPIRTFLVSTGVAKYPTVIGRFHIYARYLYTLMQGQGYYLPNVPYTQYFFEGYSIHGTYWHHNFGTPMSHGCVNMYTPDAAWMWNFATYGTLVNVHW
jgi:lipoprotein-anchoring transpeptidase ErfK/SrfK